MIEEVISYAYGGIVSILIGGGTIGTFISLIIILIFFVTSKWDKLKDTAIAFGVLFVSAILGFALWKRKIVDDKYYLF